MQVEKDLHKREQCRLNGVTLIEIPYTVTYRNPIELEEFIK